jgi:uncharacterized protein
MIVTLLLATLIGVSLGLLGGGGTILTVPILMYAAHLPAKEAIATSLLVVGLSSGLGAFQQRKSIDLRTALPFGAAGMLGAFGGGRLAAFIPAEIILLLFAGMMIATAVAMLRSSKNEAPAPRRVRPIARILIEGLIVGAVTGLVGAGGGFLVVPALVLLGGLSMKNAISTSLLVIAAKAFAGFAGYLGHVSIDLGLALAVAAAATAGTFAGSKLGARVSATRLKKIFAGLVIVMALWIVSKELPAAWTSSAVYQAIFVARWPWWIGGAAIAAVALAFVFATGRVLGVSTGCGELSCPRTLMREGPSWRIALIAGIVLGGAAAGLFAGHDVSFAVGGLDAMIGSSVAAKVSLLLGGGLLIGYGARAAGGCTSGHSIVGVALGARSSLIATALFLVAGAATTFLVQFVLGGALR